MKNANKPQLTPLTIGIAQISTLLLLLYLTSFHSYLLFHNLAEILSVVISFGIFTLTWNSRRFLDNNYYLIVGIAFLAIGALDLTHTFLYKGMGVIVNGGDPNMATQLWIAARYVTSVTFLLAPFFINKKVFPQFVLALYIGIVPLILLLIFVLKIFPTAYVEGVGMTPFKIYSEYVISLIFILSLVLLRKKKEKFDKRFLDLFSLSLVFMVISEILFTQYIGVYDLFNLLGHLLKIASSYLSYLAVVEFGLMKPYHFIFKGLKDSETSLQFERDKVKSILDAIKDGVYMVNRNYEIEYANPALIKDFGITENKNKCYEYLHERKSPCPWCKNELVFKGKTVTWEWYFPKIKKIYELIDCPVITSEGIPSKLELFHDITERKEIEKAKDEFISLASHQLRTPLSTISLSTELLLKGTAGNLNAEQTNILGETFNSVKRMALLIKNFLNVSRLEMGTFSIKKTKVIISSLIEQIFKEFEPLIKDKGISPSLEIQPSDPIQFDESIFRIIFENLLSNALRYTPRGGKITIKLVSGANSLLLSISDTGCGIPQNQQSKIFTKSFRAKNAKAVTSEGAGLGLYMVQTFVKKTNNSVWFESIEGKGTTFYVSFSK